MRYLYALGIKDFADFNATGFTGRNCPTCGCLFQDYELEILCGGNSVFIGNDCLCYEGFEKSDSGECEDIDECNSGIHDCSGNFGCVNNAGGFECLCKYGFGGSDCSDINECSGTNNCDPQISICQNLIGSYRCNCNYGYQNPFLTPTECIDFDECAESDTNNCGDNTICENLDGAYRCKCIDGFAQNSDQLSCSDIDECLVGNGGCDEISLCENTLGSRFCRCPHGFVIDENGKHCIDIDECIENAECDLSTSECQNIDGGYRCECFDGYENTDAFSCGDIDECLIDNSCHEKASCSNIDGDYRCTCLSGYAGNGTHCEDIDECTDLEIVCPPRLMKNREIIINFRNQQFNHDFSSILRSNCENIDGGHNCVCFEGFYPHQGICADVNECETGR